MTAVTDSKIIKGSYRTMAHDSAILPTAHMSVPMPRVQPTRSPQNQPAAPNTQPKGTPTSNQTPTSGARSTSR